MRITVKEQNQLVLSVLKNIKQALSGVEVPGFSFNRCSGICWNLYSNTNGFYFSGIDTDFLKPVFLGMDLHETFPVEMQLYDNEDHANMAYNSTFNLYNASTKAGKYRRKLLDDLIEYYGKKVFAEIESYGTVSLTETLNRK